MLNRQLPKPPGGVPTAHVDTFVRQLLPPEELWPCFDYSAPHLRHYPDRINAAAALIDTAVADGFGNKTAFHCEEESWSYAYLQDRADRIARVLVEDYGLVPGNRVLLRSANTPMVAACWLAVLKAGGICVATYPQLRARELSYIVEKVQIRIALCDIDLAEELEKTRTQAPELKTAGYFTPFGRGNHREANLDVAAANKPPGFRAVETAADDVAIITFTSGSTSHPKAAAHFHRDILAVTDCHPRVFPVDPDEVVCGVPSFAFTYGLAIFLTQPLRYRATSALVPHPTPDRVLEAVQRRRATTLAGVPTSYFALLQELSRGKYDLSSLRKCMSGAEPLHQKLWDDWLEATGLKLVNVYGMSELMTIFLSESLQVDRAGSSGRAIPGYTACLLDDDFNPLPPGNRGYLSVIGPTGFRYLGDAERQRNMVKNGWNVTGDIVEQDADGWFWHLDRSDEMIKSGGHNISALEVEAVLIKHPKVAECAVVGVPDPVRGKIVRACVVLRDPTQVGESTAREIQEFVKATIAPYKYPREVHFLEALPKGVTGKIQRAQLRQI